MEPPPHHPLTPLPVSFPRTSAPSPRTSVCRPNSSALKARFVQGMFLPDIPCTTNSLRRPLEWIIPVQGETHKITPCPFPLPKSPIFPLRCPPMEPNLSSPLHSKEKSVPRRQTAAHQYPFQPPQRPVAVRQGPRSALAAPEAPIYRTQCHSMCANLAKTDRMRKVVNRLTKPSFRLRNAITASCREANTSVGISRSQGCKNGHLGA